MKAEYPIAKDRLESISVQAREIVLETGKFLAEASITTVTEKEGHANLVTDMDVKVQEMLVSALSPLIPDASFLLEESEEEALPILSDFVWIIDPIDGTQNFVCQNRMSAIAVGLFYQGTGLLGIVYNPFLEEIFYAVKGQGATLNGNPIHASEHPLENSVISLGTSPYYEELREKVIHAMTTLYPICGDFRRFGSAALEICYIACGRCDGFLEYRLSPWDFAGASVILQEAGGFIGSIEKESLDFTKKSGIVAGGKNSFPALKKLV